MTIYSPSDSRGPRASVALALDFSGPVYVRLDRGKWPLLYDKQADFSEGFAMLREGTDVCIVSTGVMTHR